MKILSAEEIRNWDHYTIEQEPIPSIDLMEKAAARVTEWIMEHYPNRPCSIFCGKGNNGGDGLAVARQLMETEKERKISVFILEFGAKGTEDFQTNLARLHHHPRAAIHFIQEEAPLPQINKDELIIDALFGSGLNRGLDGLTARLVEHLNAAEAPIISIDIPSGLFSDRSAKGMTTIRATHTLSFQCYKPAFLFAENAEAIGDLHILDIGLLPAYLEGLHCHYEFITKELVSATHKPRKRFSHKGNFGHALLLAGSHGKMGAAVLSAKACLRSGAGLLTVEIPEAGYDILQSTVPEAMIMTDRHPDLLTHLNETDLSKYEAIGIGPGIGTANETKMFIRELFDHYRSPIVLDADALNILASQKDLLQLVPAGSILTPHPKEFERLFGISENDFDRAELALQKAKELKCIILLKGHHSFIALPDGATGYFNTTGNPGMATAGSGDILTGMLTGLIAQGYSVAEAAFIGVYLHGLAGDIAAEKYSMEAMIAGDIIENIGEAFVATFY